MRIKLFAVGLAATALLATTGANATEIANVNGKPVTDEMFKQIVSRLGPQAEVVKTNPEMRKRLLENVINRLILVQKAESEKLMDSKEFKDRLEESKQDVLANLYYEKYLKDNSDEKAMKKYFDANKMKFSKKEVKATHILMKDEKKAKEVLKEALKKDADFTALAKKNSEEPNAAQSGGDLGFFSRGRMVPEFEEKAFNMKKDEITKDLVKTQFGYHIIKVVDIKGDDAVKYEDAKAEVERQLKGELGKTLLDSIKKDAKIKIDDKALTDLKF